MKFTYLSDFMARFGGYPLDRVRINPAPGTATRGDIERLRLQKVLAEVVDGAVVDLAVSPRAVLVETRLRKAATDYAGRGRGVVPAVRTALVPAGNSIRVPAVAYFPRGRGPAVADIPDVVADVVGPSNTPDELFD
jgi:hypothetical protein